MRADGSVSTQDEPDVQRVGQTCTLVFCFFFYHRPSSARAVDLCVLEGSCKNSKESTYDHYGGVEEVLHMYRFLFVFNRADKLQQVRWIL